ncbi:ABC transporter ATP-binding protein [Spirochaeta lutea]|uniref:ABC transporter ATP-binding protein n=1 Tax=Spirochaeta lutea TaxID=1480694 RepID=UPI00068C9C45|nr:ABC transporter ATP-binding protein [Spirochaeta lutea]
MKKPSQAKPPNGTARFLKKFTAYLKPYGMKITVMYFFALLNVGTMIILPILVQQGIDRGILPGDMQMLLLFSGGIALTGILQFVGFRVQGVMMMKIGNSVLYDLRRDLFGRLQYLSIPYFDKNKAGNLMTRVTNDVLVLEELLMQGLDSILVDSLMIVGLVVAMIFLNPWLSLSLLVVIPVLSLIVFVLRNRIVASAEGIQKNLSTVNSYLNESLSGIQVSRAFAREDKNIRRFKEMNTAYYEQSRTFYPLHAWFWQSVATLNTFSQGLVIIGGGVLLHYEMISIGVIVAFLSYVTRLFQPMQKISNMLNQLSKAAVSGKRIFEILQEQPTVDDVPGALRNFHLQGEVEFRDVHFYYKEHEPIIRGMSFHIQPGQTCAIVGHTGSGKSTMVNLVNRFYDVQQGSVLIDQRDVRAYAQGEMRSQMSVVMQEPQIFSGTVSDNIRFGKPEAGDDEVSRVARTLGIHDMIESFPNGYDTELGQDGGNISLGQKQLLAFARALIRNPAILILDEASAYLDTETEGVIQEALRTLMRGRTSFVIAHRLSTIRTADIILVIQNGKIVERGNHGQLLALGGVYAELLKQHPV